MTMTIRKVQAVLTAQPASDGGGVRLYRIVGPDGMRRLDPFLLLDELGSDEAADYIAGFPSHPHRGFETVTYMLEGAMLHEDHLGHRARLGPGAVQWMTAGRGVIHSEMPQQEEGRMHGFQLWLNLPAVEKMKEPAYRNLPAEAIPRVTLPAGAQAKVIAGRFVHDQGSTAGAVQGGSTDPLYLDLVLPAETSVRVPVPPGHTALVYLYEGGLTLGGRALIPRQMAVLGDGEAIDLGAAPSGAKALVLAARPLREPIAHYGPFVMNSSEEVKQAMEDYEQGRLVA
jgi:redox-sensitive bicupin YhaK (pirin superfamily)